MHVVSYVALASPAYIKSAPCSFTVCFAVLACNAMESTATCNAYYISADAKEAETAAAVVAVVDGTTDDASIALALSLQEKETAARSPPAE